MDGAQFTGAGFFDVREACDAYVTGTSKFLMGEPQLSLAYISSALSKRFFPSYPEIKLEKYSKELYSVHQKVRKYLLNRDPKDIENRIKKIRAEMFEGLKKIKEVEIVAPTTQVPHLITFHVGNRRRTKLLLERWRKAGLNLPLYPHNMDYSIREPNIPCVRLGITAEDTLARARHFTRKLKRVF